MAQFGAYDPQWKHVDELFANRLMKLAPNLNKALVINDLIGPFEQYYKALNLGSITGIGGINGSVAVTANPEPRLWAGSGAPSLTTVPDGGQLGDLYIRTDTPGTLNQRLYLCTTAGTITNGVATLGTFTAYDTALQAAGNYAAKGAGSGPFLLWGGSGAPALATVPTGGAVGDVYFRTDTPGTAGQRIYVCTAAGSSSAIGTFVEITTGLNYQPAGNYSTVVTTTPTVAAGANAGTTPPAPVLSAGSNDTRGGITFGTGATPAAGTMVNVTFGTAYAAAPFIGLDASTAAASPLFLYVTNVTTTGFQIALNSAPAASQANTVYGVNYRVN